MSANSSRSSKREQWIRGIKAGGDMIMYVGSAAMTIPMIQKARENQNGLVGSCAIGAGAMLSVGIGKVASNIFNKVVDKTASFIGDTKTVDAKAPSEEDEKEE